MTSAQAYWLRAEKFQKDFIMKQHNLISILFLLTLISCSSGHEDKNARYISSNGEYYIDALEQSSLSDEHFNHDHQACEALEAPKHLSSISVKRTPSSFITRSVERSIASASELHHLIRQQSCDDITRGELDDIVEMVEYFGGSVVDPMNYPQTEDGLQRFLDDVGVSRRFTAAEMVRPNNHGAARACGYQSGLIPPRCRWMSGAIQGLLAMELRKVINDGDLNGQNGISLRNWWRPSCYNGRVGGARSSDHIQARGFDLDFADDHQRAKAQNYLCQLYKERQISLQVGIGRITLHVGLGSPKRLSNYPADGSRYWTYGSLQSSRVKRLSTDDCFVTDSRGMRYIHPIWFRPSGRTRGNL
jgi:hypothetical protein